MAKKIRKKRSLGRGGATAPAVVVPGVVTHATDATFDALVRESDVPVLVDFWAEWCGPCRRIGPIVDELAKEFEGSARMVKVNVDKCKRVASEFSVRSIPTLKLFKGGQIVDNFVGVQPKGVLERAIKKAI